MENDMKKRNKAWNKTAIQILMTGICFLSVMFFFSHAVHASPSGKVKSIKITNVKGKKITIQKGKEKTLKIKVKTKGKKVSEKYTFQSGNPKIVKAKKKGKNIRIIAKKAGKTKITITAKADKAKKFVLTVKVIKASSKKQDNLINNNKNESAEKENQNKEIQNNTGAQNNNAGSGEKNILKINSLKVLNGYSIQVELSQERQLETSDFTVMTKKYDYGAYNRNCKIESVISQDKKTYLLLLDSASEIDSGNMIRLCVDIKDGNTIAAESRYSCTILNTNHAVAFSLKVNETLKETIEIQGEGYCSIKDTIGFPKGIKAVISKDYTKVKIEGIPVEEGVFEAVLLLEDELGNVSTDRILFVVGSEDKLMAGIMPVEKYLSSDSPVWMYEYITVSGGSGDLRYEIVGDSYGLNLYGRNINGYLNQAGVYHLEIKITDRKDEKRSVVVPFDFTVKSMKKVSGRITDAEGNIISGAQVGFYNKNSNIADSLQATVLTDAQGNYYAEVPEGLYDVSAEMGNIRRYLYAKQISYDLENMNISLPLYPITILSEDASVTPDMFGQWYDSNENNVGNGNIIYLKQVKTERTEIEGVITAGKETEIPLNTKEQYYQFIPEKSGKYTFNSTGYYDTCAWLYDATGLLLTQDDDSGADKNFSFVYDCVAGQTYYFAIKSYSGEITAVISIEEAMANKE